VIEAGPVALQGGGEAVVVWRPADDTRGPRADLALLGTASGEPTHARVHVGDTVTVHHHGYEVADICDDVVELVPARG